MAKKKKKGNKYEKRVEEELDLHGLTMYQATDELSRFISEMQKEGVEHIRVITGKGLRSLNGPVLPHAVKSWLNEHGYNYTEAKLSDGGSGAIIVTL